MILWIINIILIIAVAILYFHQFSSDEKQEHTSNQQIQKPQLPPGESGKIAFINSDDLLKKYDLVTTSTDQLEKERKQKDADIKKRQKEFDQEAAYFQESMQKQSISEASAQKIYEQLMDKQQAIYTLQDKYTSELSQKEMVMNMTLLDSVRNYLHRINREYQFDYVLNYNQAGGILIAKDTFNITNIVLKGLNAEYNEMNNPVKK